MWVLVFTRKLIEIVIMIAILAGAKFSPAGVCEPIERIPRYVLAPGQGAMYMLLILNSPWYQAWVCG